MLGKILASFFAIAALLAAGKYFSNYGKLSNSDFVATMAARINSDAPRMMTEEIRLEKATFTADEFIHNYSFIRYVAEDLDAEALRKKIWPNLINGACENSEMRSALKRGIKLSYSYKGKEGKEILILSLNEGLCK